MFYRILTAAIVLGLSSTSLASPTHFMKQFQKTAKNLKYKSSLTQAKVVNQCADFTGEWVGQCVYEDGEVDEDSFTIDQTDCYHIIAGSFGRPIGGTLTMSSSPNPYAENSFPYTASISTQWNDSQTRLQSLISATMFNGFGFLSTSEMWLQGEQLRVRDVDSKALMIDNTSGWTMSKSDCTYTKK